MQETKAVTEVPPSPQQVTKVSAFKAANPFPAMVSVPIKLAFGGLAQHLDVSLNCPTLLELPQAAQKGQNNSRDCSPKLPYWIQGLNCSFPGRKPGFACLWLLAERWWTTALHMACGWTLATVIMLKSSLVWNNRSSLWEVSLSCQIDCRAGVGFVMLDIVLVF